jgi:hypothetical protein
MSQALLLQRQPLRPYSRPRSVAASASQSWLLQLVQLQRPQQPLLGSSHRRQVLSVPLKGPQQERLTWRQQLLLPMHLRPATSVSAAAAPAATERSGKLTLRPNRRQTQRQ